MAADIQHRDAKKLVRMFAKGVVADSGLTYGAVGALLGRGSRGNRAVAGICNLIDAASCLAGTPLLALGRIKNANHQINPKAWAELKERRSLVVERSSSYQFDKTDFQKIIRALDDLGGRGAIKAWTYVESLYPQELLFRRLIGDYTHNAVCDLEHDEGSDAPDRAKVSGWVYERDQKVRAKVLQRASGRCEYCGMLGFEKSNGRYYLETHHVIALANQGEDRVTNVLALCPNDHREAHFGRNAESMEEKMLRKLIELNWS